MFNRSKKKEKLYKFVFTKSNGYSWDKGQRTLLIVAVNTTDAVKKFYEMTNNNVENIIEFNEIQYGVGCESEVTRDEQ